MCDTVVSPCGRVFRIGRTDANDTTVAADLPPVYGIETRGRRELRTVKNELLERVRDPSFIPGRKEIGPLLDALSVADAEHDAIERALARAGLRAAEAAIERFASSEPPVRGRLCRLVGRVVAREASLVGWLLERLDDRDDKTRRNAILALGKVSDERIEPALVERWAKEPRVETRRALATALGKTGGARARSLLAGVRSEDAELARIVREALLKVERTVARDDDASLDAAARFERPLRVRYHARRGLERILADEIDGEIVGSGVVEVEHRGALAEAFRARTALRFGFPLRAPRGAALEDAVVSALASDEARAIVRRFTRGVARYRIEWASAGHRRAATFRVASRVAEVAPELRNDPTRSVWEVVVAGEGASIEVELWPKALDDPRFAYRVAEVPASSHPTIAAALARVAGVRRDEVVWDPFVGAGAELIERARLAPCRALYGNDIDARAVAAAHANLAAAGLSAIVVEGDARASRPPEPVSLVLTNPPMGRRVRDREGLAPLFDAVLANVMSSLRRDGRIVWLSPLFGRTVVMAAKHGLRVDRRGAVDLGGFDAELQVLEKKR